MRNKKYLMLLCCIIALACVFSPFTTTVAAAEIDEHSPVVSPADDSENFPYIVLEGSRYFRSAWGCGTGRYGTVTATNQFVAPHCYAGPAGYTDINPDGSLVYAGCYAGVDGYAFIDEDGRIIAADYQAGISSIDIPAAPAGTVYEFWHFHSATYRNGWTNRNNFVPVPKDSDSVIEEETSEPVTEPVTEEVREELSTAPTLPEVHEEQSPEDVADDILSITSTDAETVVLIDLSGSMNEHQKEVISFLEQSEFSENTTFVVFASIYKEVSSDEIMKDHFGWWYSGTELFKALNYVVSLPDIEHLIVISDLDTGDYRTDLTTSKTLTHVWVYDPDNNERIDSRTIKAMQNAWPDAMVSRTEITK